MILRALYRLDEMPHFSDMQNKPDDSILAARDVCVDAVFLYESCFCGSVRVNCVTFPQHKHHNCAHVENNLEETTPDSLTRTHRRSWRIYTYIGQYFDAWKPLI